MPPAPTVQGSDDSREYPDGPFPAIGLRDEDNEQKVQLLGEPARDDEDLP